MGQSERRYGDSNWKDKLTAYGDTPITYDAIGNPLTYRGYTLTWQNGRQLASMKYGAINIGFTYDVDGLRTSKTIPNVGLEHKYYYVGDRLQYETLGGSSALWYFYDADGNPSGIRYKNGDSINDYYFVCNWRGDVIQIYNASGTLVGSYTYDAWGRVTENATSADTENITETNPIRYRGYYYDTETRLYYLKSRYYDPAVKRFLNEDSQLNMKYGFIGYNMFTYCNNNPVVYLDPSGHSFVIACIIVGAVIGALAGGHVAAKISKSKTGKVNGWAVAGGIVGGGIAGALLGWGVGAATTAIGAAATSAAGTATVPAVGKIAEKTSTALQTYYPPNDGFSGTIEKITIDVGTLIQRTGDLGGRFTAPAGTPPQMLSLPYDKIGQATTCFQTTQPIQALSGQVAPWFGQMGGGTQYLLLDGCVDKLLEDGVLIIFGG